MSQYKLCWKRSALKELQKLPRTTVSRLVALAESLVDEPYPSGCHKLAGTEHTYRVRTGDYRLVYQVHNGQLVVEVVRVGHRKNIYR